MLSICIPVYNQKNYINDLLESIGTQINKKQIPKIEILICDNFSNDGTEEIIRSRKDFSIKLYKNKKNIGFAKNLIKCITKARGDYVTFMGGDDILYSLGNLILNYKFMKKKKLGLCFSPIFISQAEKNSTNQKIKIFDKNKKIYLQKKDALLNSWLESGLASLGGWIIKKRALDKKQLKIIPSNSIFPEFYLGYFVISKGLKVANFNKPFYLQRNRNDISQLANKQYTSIRYYSDLSNIIKFEKDPVINENLNNMFCKIFLNNVLSLKVFGVKNQDIYGFVRKRKIYRSFDKFSYIYLVIIFIFHKNILKLLLFFFRKIKYLKL
jgi:glycosyltransferase involved in cell wall biosynthesis